MMSVCGSKMETIFSARDFSLSTALGLIDHLAAETT